MMLYQPAKDREPFFTGSDTKEAAFDSGCPHCKARIRINFKEMLDAAWGWTDKMEEDLKVTLAKVFRISLSNNSIGMGMPGVVVHSCADCGMESYFHFLFRETSNSVYSISLRAAATDDPNQAEQGSAHQPTTR